MCFSAKASFITAGTLSLIGLLSIRTAAKKTKKLITFAATPFIFALQQACEGIVWIGLTTDLPDYLYKLSIYGFIFFAGICWPLWGPIALSIIEHNKTRQKLLLITLGVGTTTSIIYVFSLATQPVDVFTVNHHIYYPNLSYPLSSKNSFACLIESVLTPLYVTATVIPFFLSSIRFMWIVGIVMGLLGIISLQLYTPTTASVWCFFAALTSALIYMIVRHKKNGTTVNEMHSN